MDLSSLDLALAEVAESRAAAYVQEFGEGWAIATANAAPVRTGALRRSVRWVGTGTLSGYLEVIYYGQFVQRGHAVRGRGGTRRTTPNPFLSRGAASAYVPLSPQDVALLRAAASAAIAETIGP